MKTLDSVLAERREAEEEIARLWALLEATLTTLEITEDTVLLLRPSAHLTREDYRAMARSITEALESRGLRQKVPVIICLHDVAELRVIPPREMAEFGWVPAPNPPTPPPEPAPPGLSRSEWVSQLRAEGRSYAAIGAALGISGERARQLVKQAQEGR